MITTKEYRPKQKIEAVKLNKSNRKSVAEWAGATVVETQDGGWHLSFPRISGIVTAGTWIYRVQGTTGFKVMTADEFKKKFELIK